MAWVVLVLAGIFEIVWAYETLRFKSNAHFMILFLGHAIEPLGHTIWTGSRGFLGVFILGEHRPVCWSTDYLLD